MGIFSAAKDRLLERAALSYLNARVPAEAGRIVDLRVDSTARSIDLTVELKGETAPIEIHVNDYELSREGERYFVTLNEIRTSREWLTVLGRERICRRRIELPPDAGRLLMAAL